MDGTLYQGNLDVFLAKVRADFDAVEDQAVKSVGSVKSYSLVGSDPLADTVFTEVGAMTDDGERAVWRHVGVTGVKSLGQRQAGGQFSDVEFIRTYETAVFDPDNQPNGKFKVPSERQDKEGKMYKTVLNRASKLLMEIQRLNIQDPFEVFNIAFTAPASYPTAGIGKGRFFARGNMGLDGNNTALGERLISTQHARADGGTSWSNAIQSSGNAAQFTDDNYWAAKIQGSQLVDDVGKPYPAFGGSVTIVTAVNNVRSAKEIQDSEWKVNVADNNVNILQGMFNKVIASPYLNASAYVTGVANPYQWFLIDGSMKDPEVGTGLMCLNFVPLESDVFMDKEVRSVVYNVSNERVYGFVDPRIVLGSKGDNAAYSA